MASLHAASHMMQVDTQTAMVQTAGMPKNQMPAAVVGNRAIMTSSMMPDTLDFACVWGDELSMKC